MKPRIIGRDGWQVALPGGPLTLVQIVIGILDLGCCAMAMYWLVPDEPHLGFIQVAVIFVAATLLGFASHAPGGLGVFDATMMVALWQFDKEDLLAGLLLFRLLYYIVPFILSLSILGVRELLLGRNVRRLTPPVAAADALRRRAGAGKIGRDLIRLATGRLRGAVSMSLNDDRVAHQSGGWRRLRLMIVTAAAVFAGLTILDALAVGYAVAGFVIVAAAAYLAMRADRDVSPLARPVAVSERAGDSLQAVVAGLPDPVIALDRNGRVLTLNEHARSLAPALRQGEPVSLALRMPELIEAIGRAYATGEEQRVEYSERVPLDRWFETIVVPVKRQPNPSRPELVLMTFHDLTPLRRVEEMRADFVANASHELRTPLAALSGFIETLQGSARDDAKARERFLAIMQEQARRMARLIDDLLSLSRIELNAHRRPDSLVDLVPIVRQVVDGLETLARDRGVTVQIEAARAMTVPGDRDELVRVFENLVENALKYGAPGKRVDVTLAPHESAEGEPEAQVAIRDYGPGIAPEHLPRLTERFYRVDVTESRAQGGTGLGLALVKHILNRHRGRLSIESKLGAGATFTVQLPTSVTQPVEQIG